MDPWLAPDGAPRKDVSQMSNPDGFFLGVESSASGRAWRNRLDARGNVARMYVDVAEDIAERSTPSNTWKCTSRSRGRESAIHQAVLDRADAPLAANEYTDSVIVEEGDRA